MSLAEAVDAGVVVVDDRGLHLKALDAEETPPQLGATRDAIFQEVGTIQLPELMLAVDHATRFSWRLLGRARQRSASCCWCMRPSWPTGQS